MNPRKCTVRHAGLLQCIYSVNQFIGNPCKCLFLPSTKCSSQSIFCSFNESGFTDHPGFKKKKKNMFLAEYDLEEFPLLLWSLLPLLISGFLLLNITSCSPSATKCDFVILSVSCSSHISQRGITILIEEEKKYRILYVCVHVYTRNRRVKGERSEEGIKWINTNNKIWSSVFVPSNFTFFFFFFGLKFLSISSLIVLTCRMADIWNELCLMNPDSQLCSLTPCQQPVTHISHVMPSHHSQVRSKESLKYVSGIMKYTLRSLSKSIWL